MREREIDADQRKRIRRSAILFGMIALAFYLSFVAMALIRGSR